MAIKIRKQAVAGTFYPGDPQELKETINHFFSEVKEDHKPPKAIIAPHAGYRYSGAIAASAYACLKKVRDKITRVVMMGPTHFYPVLGIAAPESDFFETPLGQVKVDREAIYEVLYLPQIKVLEPAHIQEHSLEIQLPFLQMALGDFALAPFVVGNVTTEQVAEVLELLWGGDETLIVISSDLSHYHDYDTAQKIDQKTVDAILALDPDGVALDDACGGRAIRGLLTTAAKKKIKPTLLDLRNSGDTFGDKSKVVGYSAVHFS